MKIQCNVCEVAEAKVLCCADEAALCQACDEKVHAANKLASKHLRVSLCSSSSPMPKCDICQETVGHFFCLEDRALLCRKCDVAIHTVNTFVSSHQRFLLTGVKVGLEPIEHSASLSLGKLRSGEKILAKSHSGEKVSEVESHSSSRKGVPISLAGQGNQVLPVQVSDFEPTMLSFAGSSAAGSMQQWQVEEFLGLNELNQNYIYMDNGSSKADSGKLGDSDCSPILRAAEIELDSEEGLVQVPEASWAVPQITSPPTASGLYWPKNYQRQMDTAAFVPDIYCSPMQNPHRCQRSGAHLKRLRQF